MLRIRVLGEMQVEIDDVPIALPRSRRACTLLAWLALHPGTHGRGRTAARFWPDVGDSSARASLRSAVWTLRTTLGGGDALTSTRETIGIASDGVWVDALVFQRLLAQDRLVEAIELSRGDLLEAFDDEWVFEAREEHGRRLDSALAMLAAKAEAADDRAAAIQWTRRRALANPFDQGASRALMELLARDGDVAGALAVYSRISDRLRVALGIAPDPETRSLAARLRGEASGAFTPATPDGGGASFPLIGRDCELQRILAVAARAIHGQGGVVVICGEGGIGKTHLAREAMVAPAMARAAPVLAIGVGAAPASPFSLWTDLLSELQPALLVSRGGPKRDLRESLARLRGDLAPVADGGERSATGAAPGLERIRLFDSLASVLAMAAAERPLALVLEDVHLADTSSLELLVHLGRRLVRMRILLLLTRRPLPHRAMIEAALARLRAFGAIADEIALEPLPETQIRALANGVARLRGPDVDRVVDVAAGNPLVALELTRALASGQGEGASSLRAVVRIALARLAEEPRAVIELAAVAGGELPLALIAAGPMLRAPTISIDEALESGLLRDRGGRVGFRHGLLADAVYEDLSPSRRTDLHEALAEMLAAERPRRPAEIARHLRLAGRPELAVEHLLRAAGLARSVAALDEAAELLRKASELSPEAAGPALELAEVEAWRGRLQESDSAFESALRRIPSADAGQMTRAWLRRGRWLRGGLCHPLESRRSYRSALDLLDRAPELERDARAEALTGIAWAESVAGDPEKAHLLLSRVEELMGDGRRGPLLSHDVDVARAHALLRAGRFSECYEPLLAAGSEAGRADRPDLAYACLANAAGAAACAGQTERALEFADRSLGTVAPAGLLPLAVQAQSARTILFLRLGRRAQAEAAASAASELADRTGLPALEGLVEHDRGILALAAADPERASGAFARALELGAPVSRPRLRLLHAESLARCGNALKARSELRATALEPISAGDFPDTLLARMNRIEALIALAAGDEITARRRLEDAATGWRRRVAVTELPDEGGARYMASLIDLGRPPLSALVEPERELADVLAELDALDRNSSRVILDPS